MASIRDYVKSNFPETFGLALDGKYLDEDGADVVTRAIAIALEMKLAVGVDEPDLTSAFVKKYLADLATVMLIPTAKDWIVTTTRLQEGFQGPDFPPHGGEIATNYDRNKALEKLEERLRTDLMKNESLFLDLIGTDGRPGSPAGVGLAITTNADSLRTRSPDDYPKFPGRNRVVIGPGGVTIAIRDGSGYG